MSRLDDYAADAAAGMQQGVGDVARSAVADIGNSYQEILMSHASVSPSSGITGTMENVTVEMDHSDPLPPPEPAVAPTTPDQHLDIE